MKFKTPLRCNSTIFAVILALLTGFPVTARTLQAGMVKEYNERDSKTPLTGVSVQVRKAQPTVTESDGSFALDFLTGSPGERVSVRRIEKPGYEVFNTAALEQWNISPDSPFIIIMCKSSRLKAIRDHYERVTSASYARQFEAEQARLEKRFQEGKLKQAEYEKKLSDLQEDYEKRLDNIEAYADRFARIDLSELSDAEAEIIALVQVGELEKAVEMYENQNFVAKYAAEVRDIARIDSATTTLNALRADKEASRKALREGIDRQISTLRLAGGGDNIRRISEILRDVYLSDTTDIAAAINYARELISVERSHDAADVMLSAARQSATPEQLTSIYVTLGNAYANDGLTDKALEAYQLVIETADKITDNDEFRRERINTVKHNMAVIYANRLMLEEGAAVEAEVIADLEQSDLTEPETLKSYIRSLNTAAGIERQKHNYDASIALFDKAIALCDSIPDTKEQKEDRYLLFSTLLGNRAIAKNSKGDRDGAISDMKIALATKQTLFELINPEKYRAILATAEHNLAYFYEQIGHERAIYHAMRALKQRKEILKKAPYSQTAGENYLKTAELAISILHNGNTDEMKRIVDDVCATVDALPGRSLVLQGLVEQLLGVYNYESKQFAESASHHVAAAEIFSSLADYDKSAYQKSVVDSWVNAAMSASKDPESTLSAGYLDRADSLVAQIAPSLSSSELLGLYNRMMLSTFQTDPVRAVIYLRQMQPLAPKNARYVEYEAIFLDHLGREDEARDAFLRLKELRPDYPDNPLSQKYGQ